MAAQQLTAGGIESVAHFVAAAFPSAQIDAGHDVGVGCCLFDQKAWDTPCQEVGLKALPGSRHNLADVLHRIFVVEGHASMRDVARALGLSYPAFYARVSGRVPFAPEEITKVIREVPDQRLLDALLADTEFIAFRRPVLKSRGGEAISDAAFRSLRAISAVLEKTHSVSLTSQLDRAERDEIEDRLTEAERSLGVIRFALAQLRSKSMTPASETEQDISPEGATGSVRCIEPDRACSDLSN